MNVESIAKKHSISKATAPCTPVLGVSWQIAGRDYRRAIAKHAFTELQWVIVDLILRWSIERGRYKARIPKRRYIAQVAGIDEGDVSRLIRDLARQSVIEVEAEFYSICPHDAWTMPVRVKETAELQELEVWLENLSEDQPALLPAEASFNDALRETFVESSSVESSRVESGSQVGESPTGSGRKLGNHQPGVGESPTGLEVPCTTRASIDRSDRLIESRITSSRSGSIDRSSWQVGESPTRSEYRSYVEGRLFGLIGQAERNSRSGDLWRRALEVIPEKVDELCSVALEKKRTGAFNRTKSPNPSAAWMNSSLRAELQLWYAKGAK